MKSLRAGDPVAAALYGPSSSSTGEVLAYGSYPAASALPCAYASACSTGSETASINSSSRRSCTSPFAAKAAEVVQGTASYEEEAEWSHSGGGGRADSMRPPNRAASSPLHAGFRKAQAQQKQQPVGASIIGSSSSSRAANGMAAVMSSTGKNGALSSSSNSKDICASYGNRRGSTAKHAQSLAPNLAPAIQQHLSKCSSSSRYHFGSIWAEPDKFKPAEAVAAGAVLAAAARSVFKVPSPPVGGSAVSSPVRSRRTSYTNYTPSSSRSISRHGSGDLSRSSSHVTVKDPQQHQHPQAAAASYNCHRGSAAAALGAGVAAGGAAATASASAASAAGAAARQLHSMAVRQQGQQQQAVQQLRSQLDGTALLQQHLQLVAKVRGMQVQYKAAATATAAAASAARGAVQRERQQQEQQKQQQQDLYHQQQVSLQHLQLQTLMHFPTMALSLSSDSPSPSLLSPSASSPSSARSPSTARTAAGVAPLLSEPQEHQVEEDLQHLQLQALMRLRTSTATSAGGGMGASLYHINDEGQQPQREGGVAVVAGQFQMPQTLGEELGSHKQHLQHHHEQLQRYQEILRVSLGGAITQHSQQQERTEALEQQLEQDGSLLDLLQQLQEVKEEVSLEYRLEQEEQQWDEHQQQGQEERKRELQKQQQREENISEEQSFEEYLQHQEALEQQIRQEEDAELQRYLQDVHQQWPDVQDGEQQKQQQQQEQEKRGQDKQKAQGGKGRPCRDEGPEQLSQLQQQQQVIPRAERGVEGQERQSRDSHGQLQPQHSGRATTNIIKEQQHHHQQQQVEGDTEDPALLAEVHALELAAAEMKQERGGDSPLKQGSMQGDLEPVPGNTATPHVAEGRAKGSTVAEQGVPQQSEGTVAAASTAWAAAGSSRAASEKVDEGHLDDDEFDEAFFQDLEFDDEDTVEGEVDPQVAAELFAIQQHMLQLQQQLQQAGKQLCSSMGKGTGSPSFAAAGREAAAAIAAAATTAAAVAEQQEQQIRRISFRGRRTRGSMAGRGSYSRSTSTAGVPLTSSSLQASAAAESDGGISSSVVDDAAEAAEAALASALAALGAEPPAALLNRRRYLSTNSPGAAVAMGNVPAAAPVPKFPSPPSTAAAAVARRQSSPQLPPRPVGQVAARVAVKGSSENDGSSMNVSEQPGQDKKGMMEGDGDRQEPVAGKEEGSSQQHGGPLQMQSLMAALRHVRLALTNSPAAAAPAQQQQQQGYKEEGNECQKEKHELVDSVGCSGAASGAGAVAGGGGIGGVTHQHVLTALQQLALALQDNTTLAWEVSHLQELMVQERVRGW